MQLEVLCALIPRIVFYWYQFLCIMEPPLEKTLYLCALPLTARHSFYYVACACRPSSRTEIFALACALLLLSVCNKQYKCLSQRFLGTRFS
jgi:hypothetical protein